ncbi:MAG: glycine cleavage T C-terminal barrel domain-containing protein [Gemmatimonadota bacterium]
MTTTISDTIEEYRAARGTGAVFERADRVLLAVRGRSPTRMLTGICSGRMPPELTDAGSEVQAGEAPYSTVLTPKGKLVTDLRVLRLGNGEGGGLLLDVPAAGIQRLREHLTKYLPPRFAKLEEPAGSMGILSVTGSEAASILSREVFGLRLGAEELAALPEGGERLIGDPEADGLRVVRNGDVRVPAFDLITDGAALRSLGERFGNLGLVSAGPGTWETFRIEAGRPRFGAELAEDTLPPEAGIHNRAIDDRKGCYTGQEVIVRIRDRGRVNRHLRGLLLGDAPPPEPGTPLFIEGRERQAGEVRSAVTSPGFGQTIALGYVRREAEPPTTARLGSADGPEVQVRALSDEGWVLLEGDPGVKAL